MLDEDVACSVAVLDENVACSVAVLLSSKPSALNNAFEAAMKDESGLPICWTRLGRTARCSSCYIVDGERACQ